MSPIVAAAHIFNWLMVSDLLPTGGGNLPRTRIGNPERGCRAAQP
jgi:hypothetical protein